MTLCHALEHLERVDVLRYGLGKTPQGDYLDYFVATKRNEVRSSHAEVTPWELDRYLQAF
jgi:glutamine synthetase